MIGVSPIRPIGLPVMPPVEVAAARPPLVLIDECFGTGPLGFTPDMIAIGRGGDGDLYGATARASTGYVREFAVFDSVLTQAEVEAYIVESAAPGLDVHSATRAAILCSCCVVGLLLRR